MTKAEDLFLEKYGNKIMASESWVIRFAEECVNLRLSEQKEKHDKEMEEFLDWTYKNGWRHSVTPNFFIRVEYPDIVEERVTFTELLKKFRE